MAKVRIFEAVTNKIKSHKRHMKSIYICHTHVEMCLPYKCRDVSAIHMSRCVCHTHVEMCLPYKCRDVFAIHVSRCVCHAHVCMCLPYTCRDVSAIHMSRCVCHTHINMCTADKRFLANTSFSLVQKTTKSCFAQMMS